MNAKESNIQQIYPLTPVMEGILFHSLADENSSAYFEQLWFSISGAIDLEAFKRSWQEVINTFEVLRSVFRWENTRKPVQIVLKKMNLDFRMIDTQDSETEQQAEREIENLIERDRQKGFDLKKGPLMRLILVKIHSEEWTIIWDFHHIIMDGWSKAVVLNCAAQYYTALKKGNPLPGISTSSYKAYISWLASHPVKEAEEFWHSYVNKGDEIIYFPSSPGNNRLDEIKLKEIIFPEFEARKIEEFARNNTCTINSMLLGLWMVLCYKYTSGKNLFVGTTVSGRSVPVNGMSDMVGTFINTLPMSVASCFDDSILKLIKNVNSDLLDFLKYEFYPLVEIMKLRKTSKNSPLFNHIFVFENYPVNEKLFSVNDSDFRFHSFNEFSRNNYDLNIIIIYSGKLHIKIMYNPGVYEPAFIDSLSKHYSLLVETLLNNPGQTISTLSIATEEEKKQIAQFNDTAMPYINDRSIMDLFQEQVERTPDNTALVFSNQCISYRELNRKANRLCHVLTEKGVGPDVGVGIILHRSVEMMAGIFGILKAGGAYVPISPEYPEERISFMIADSGIKILLTRGPLVELLNSMETGNTVEILNLDDDSIYSEKTDNPANTAGPDNLAYIIYTSGSTGKPKGTMIEHHSVINRIKWMQERYPLRHEDRILQKTPFTFDVSVWELFWWAFEGASAVLLIPGGEKDPGVIADAINRQRITVMHFVPSLFSAFLDYLETNKEARCLSGLRQIFCSGEALTSRQVTEFNALTRNNGNCKLTNLYGPTEATVDVSYYDCPSSGAIDKVPIGKPIHNIKLYITDEHLNLNPIGIPGELCISGAGVGRGYLNRKELTAEKFIKDPINSGMRLYRTGDLARWLNDGNIEFIGRIDNQVKIRGNRIEPGEVESQLLKIEQIREAVVTVNKDIYGNNYLCAYFIADKDRSQEISPENISAEHIRSRLLKSIPDYMVPSRFIPLEAFPLTPNGKINRKALPDPHTVTGNAEYAQPQNEREKTLVSIWKEVLGNYRIGIHNNFFTLGGDSIKAIVLQAKIKKAFETDFPLSLLLKKPTIAEFSESLEKILLKKVYSKMEKAPVQQQYELSHSQMRLWFFKQMLPQSTAYNISVILNLKGEVDKDIIGQCFQEIVDRHGAFRTEILLDEDVPKQIIQEHAPFFINYIDLSENFNQQLLDDHIKKECRRIFDFSKPPLLNISLFKKADRDYVLTVIQHHIISDGWSIQILIKDFLALYNHYKYGEPLNLTPVQFEYIDYVHYQNKLLAENKLLEQKKYWLEKLKGNLPVPEIFTDHPRPQYLSDKADRISFSITGDLYTSMLITAGKLRITIFMLLQGVLKILLYKYTQCKDIILGTLIAARPAAELENIIGYFVNILALRDQVNPEHSFIRFMEAVKDTVLEAYDNQEYPFDKMVEDLQLKRNIGHSPVFDYMFVYHKWNELNLTDNIRDLEIKALKRPDVINKYELYFEFLDYDTMIEADFEYSTDLYSRETITRFAENFINLLSLVLAAPEKKLREYESMSLHEKQLTTVTFNNTQVEYDTGKSVYHYLEYYADASPAAIAFSFNGKEITYKELNEQVNRLARFIRQLELNENSIVALLLNRSIDMAVSILAIWKTGHAYLPLDAANPAERNLVFLTEAQVPLIISHSSLISSYKNATPTQIILLDEQAGAVREMDTANIDHPFNEKALSYVIFTSGSTGKPKGVMIEHIGMMNHLSAKINDLHMDSSSCVAQVASQCFDISIWQFFAALCSGGKTIIYPNELFINMDKFMDTVSKDSITILEVVPSYLAHMFQYLENRRRDFSRLCYLLVTGEAVKVHLVKKWFSLYPDIRMVNAYGPTEASDDITHYIMEAPPETETVPIGYPLQNFSIYIVSGEGNLCPVGVTGEIWVSGAGVGRGYINNPEITGESFIVDPFTGTPGRRLYKTGDLGRWLSDGRIECLGRKDYQVKIRGYRIELGEIEEALIKYEGVEFCAVITGKKEEDTLLRAFIQSKQQLFASEIRTYLGRHLPEYMIPSEYNILDKIPITPNGKVDRKALEAMEVNRIDVAADREIVEPRTRTQKIIARIWKKYLDIDQLSIYDSFFDIGGHSLLMPRIHGELFKHFPMKVEIPDLFTYHELHQLAAYIDGDMEEVEYMDFDIG